MAEGDVAGRLEIPVEADVSDFRRKLKAKVEAAAENVAARVGIEFDSEKDLRARLETVVSSAAAGVKAKVGVEIDVKQAKATIEKAVAGAASDVQVAVEGDSSLVQDTAKATAEAQAEAKANPVEVPVTGRNRLRSTLVRWIAEARAIAASGGGGTGKGGGIDVPVRVKAPRGRMVLRGAFYGLIISLLQPAIATIGSLVGGLAAMIGPLGQVTRILAAAPGLLAGLGAGILAVVNGIGALRSAAETLAAAREELGKTGKFTAAELRKIAADSGEVGFHTLRAAQGVETLGKTFRGLRRDAANVFFKQFAGQIEAAGKALRTTLAPGFKAVSATAGGFVAKFTTWFRTPMFRGDFRQVMQVANRAFDAMGDSLFNLVKATTNLIVASKPLMARVNGWIRGFGEWAERTSRVGRETGTLADKLDRAGERAAQWGRILRDAWTGIVGVFSAGMGVGDSLTRSLEKNMARFTEWANGDGADDIRRWFEAIEPTFRAGIHLIGEIGKALGRMSADDHTAALLNQIADELIPALEAFLTTLGQNLAPTVVDFLSDLAHALEGLASAGGGIATALDLLDRLVEVFNRMNDATDGALGRNLGTLLGLFIAYKGIKGLGKALGLGKLAGALAKFGSGAVKRGLARLAGLAGAGGLAALVRGAARGGPGGGKKPGKGGGLGSIFRGPPMKVTFGGVPQPVYGAVPGGGTGVVPGGKGKDKVAGSRGRGPRGGSGGLRIPGGKAGKIGGALAGLAGLLAGLRGKTAKVLNRVPGSSAVKKGLAGLGRIGASLRSKAGKVLGKVPGGGLFKKGGKALGGKGGIAGIAAYLGADWLAGKVQDGKGGGRDSLAGGLRGAATGAGLGAMVGSVVPGLGTAIGAAVGGAIGAVTGAMKGHWSKLGGFIKGNSGKLATLAAGGIALVGRRLKPFQFVASAAKNVGPKVVGAFRTVGPQVGGALRSVGGFVRTHLGGAAATAGRLAGQAKTKITQNFGQARDLAGRAFGALRTRVGAAMGGARDKAATAARVLRDKVGTALSGARDRATNAARALRDRVGTAMTGARDKAASAARALRDRVGSAVQGARDKAAAAARALRDRVGSAMQGARDKAASAANALRSRVGSAMQGARDRAVSAMNAAKQRVGSAMQGMKASVSAKANAIVTTMGALKGRMTGALSGARGAMSKIGSSIMGGLMAGLEAGKRRLGGVLGGITQFIKDNKGPEQVDKKLLRPAGRWIMDGLIAGFKDRERSLSSTLGTLTERITKSLRDDLGRKDPLAKQFAELDKTMDERTKRYNRVAAKIKQARDELRSLRAERRDYIKGLSESMQDPTSVGSLMSSLTQQAADALRAASGEVEEEAEVVPEVTVGGFIQGMRNGLDRLTAFTSNIQTLAARGLNKESLRQIAESGIEVGGAIAAKLAAGGQDALAAVNDLQAKIAAVADAGATVVGNKMHEQGIAAAEGLVAGLVERQDKIMAVMRRIARRMVATIRKALKMHSPSRVFAGVGHDGADGLIVGWQEKLAAIRATMGDVARTVAGVSIGTPGGLLAAGASALGSYPAAGPSRQVIFEEGAVTVNNPAPEPASQSVHDRLRRTAAFGLFG